MNNWSQPTAGRRKRERRGRAEQFNDEREEVFMMPGGVGVQLRNARAL
jgi:hypothetical protein